MKDIRKPIYINADLLHVDLHELNHRDRPELTYGEYCDSRGFSESNISRMRNSGKTSKRTLKVLKETVDIHKYLISEEEWKKMYKI